MWRAPRRGPRIDTLANRRLPACTTTVVPAATSRERSATTSPSTLRPRCAISRSASEVESTTPARFARLAIAMPAPAVSIVSSGMVSGIAPPRKRASNSASAASAAATEWNRATISFASATLVSRGLRPAAVSSCSRSISAGARNETSGYQRHIRSSEIDITLPNISPAGSLMPT